MLVLYLLVQFVLTVQRDVKQRISELSMGEYPITSDGGNVNEDYVSDIVQEISICAGHYNANSCGSNPVPAVLQPCGEWETCKNRDPTEVRRAKVVASLIAEVINGFVDPLSWRSLVCGFS